MKTITMPIEEYQKELEDLKKSVKEQTLSGIYSQFHNLIVYGSGDFEGARTGIRVIGKSG